VEFLDFFRRSNFVVDSSVDDATVELYLEKALEHNLMKALRVETYPHAPGTPVVAALLTDYPCMSWLVGLALIQLGYCGPYSKVHTRFSTLIQTTCSEDTVLQKSIFHIIDTCSLPRLANFMCDPKKDDDAWRNLFSGCSIGVLESILVEFGKTQAELSVWNTLPKAERHQRLVKAAEMLALTTTHPVGYKIRILRFLRSGKPTPHMLPWLDSEELKTFLNPAPVDEILVLEPVPEPVTPSDRAQVEAIFATAKVSKPAFIDLFISEGYRLDHLEDVLTHFDNPDTQPLRALLTGPNKLDILKALRAPQ
jgi:hypothetical protein